jgi:hypothetical protein
MGAKYLPNIKDQKAIQRFQRVQAQKNPTVKPPASAAQPKPEKKK